MTDEHGGEASRFGSHTGSLISDQSEPISKNHKTKKPSVLLGSDGLGYPSETLPSDPDGSRTRVTAVKGRCPRPLDDGASSLW